MKLIIYPEEDRFAKQVATTLHGLRTMNREGHFSDFRYVARERVWSGAVAAINKLGQAAEYPMILAAVSFGPDYNALLKACQAEWTDVVRLQTWKPDCGKSRPKGLMRFVPGSPVTVLLRDSASFWVSSEAERWRKKCEADARRVALQIIETLLVRPESWLSAIRAKAARSSVPAARRPRTPPSLRPYFAEP